MVAQPEPADRPLVVAHPDGSFNGHVLLVVTAGEAAGVILREGSSVVVHGLAAVHG